MHQRQEYGYTVLLKGDGKLISGITLHLSARYLDSYYLDFKYLTPYKIRYI